MIKYFIVFTRCYYYHCKLAFSPKKRYKIPWWFYFDIIIALYTFRLYGISYLMRNNFETLYNFKVYDPVVHYICFNLNNYDLFMPVMVSLFIYFSFLSYFAMIFVNSKADVWIFWYNLTVVNQNIYHECQKSKKEVNVIYSQKLKKFYLKFKIFQYFPNFAIKYINKIYSNIYLKKEIFFNMDDINKKNFLIAK